MNRAAVPATDDPLSEGSSSAEAAFVQQTDLSGTVRYVVNGVGAKRFGGDGGLALDALLNFPTAVAADAEGDLYIADTMNHRIRRVDAGTGRITTIAGVGLPRFGGDGGPSVAAGLNEPAALAVQGARLYIADQSNNRIRMVDLRHGSDHDGRRDRNRHIQWRRRTCDGGGACRTERIGHWDRRQALYCRYV